MGQAGIFIPFADLEGDPGLKGAIRAYLAAQVGFSPVTARDQANPDEEGLAELSVGEAQRFLNNCSEKTVKVLTFIVARDGQFLASELNRHMRVKDLRGVWTGLTRRLRNVTKSDDASLINWFYKAADDDWRGVMAARTASAFRAALADRE